jgi:WXG100 family type VII secretion target
MASEETLRADPAAMQGFARALCGGVGALRARLAELDTQVGEMLGGWRGEAGGAYGSAWELWHRGAGEVMLGLSMLAKAIDGAGAEYRNNESASAWALGGVGDG